VLRDGALPVHHDRRRGAGPVARQRALVDLHPRPGVAVGADQADTLPVLVPQRRRSPRPRGNRPGASAGHRHGRRALEPARRGRRVRVALSKMPGAFTGYYLDGRSATRREASIRLSASGLEISFGDGTRLWWPLREVRQTQGAYAGEQIRLER